MTRPLYSPASEKPAKRANEGHAGLWFDKFCNQWVRGAVWSMSSSADNNPKLAWINCLAEKEVGTRAQIKECTLRVTKLVESCQGKWSIFTSTSRFVTGLGRSHPVENGFAWHPTLGTPFIPGSSIKGMVRAWAQQECCSHSDKELVNRLLGQPDTVGSVSILDAVPIAPVRLEADVMTPHTPDWNKDEPPGDWHSPKPIPFLVMAADTSLLFGFIPCDNTVSEEDLGLLVTWLQEALEWTGVGAKTAVGYGRFTRDNTETDNLRRDLQEQLIAERKRTEREERFVRLSPIEREIVEVLENRSDPGMPETTAIYNEIECGRWTGEEKIEAARWLESKMKTTKKWKPKPQAKKKNKDHTRTLQVIQWLKGE